MILYPAIDLLNGSCVRLYQGDYLQSTTYSSDPVATAKQFASDGAEWLHLVDLSAANNPKEDQFRLIRSIINECDINVQIGGGIRTKEHVENLLNVGASRVVIGSLAITSPESVKTWMQDFGCEKIALAMDIINPSTLTVAIHGWKEASKYSLVDLIFIYKEFGLKHVLSTNIFRDGTLAGPDQLLYKELVSQFPSIQFQASGGIQSLSDLGELKINGLKGAIIGRALYENKFSLREALLC